mmetsp:Transcript_2841/g.6682  ORF Transcript_2841/g.6682 Transcript_2841/m.6682 type:complete len:86 (-) Transcript_2841:1982-2239(-)
MSAPAQAGLQSETLAACPESQSALTLSAMLCLFDGLRTGLRVVLRSCWHQTGYACSWVEPRLCSRGAGFQEKKSQPGQSLPGSSL